jgi:hypothetical protein
VINLTRIYKIEEGYKLFRLRKDGTLGSLFIDRKKRMTVGEWYLAGVHSTKGYAYRPGWHICHSKSAPHLSEKDRVWTKVKFYNYESHVRPENQGGLWYTADAMKIVEICK